ncbi:FAD/NAD(P)-binding oxidoreductase [Burkholderia sp. WAC0059]|nr:FAD/NAD(P)-binding oxidoreductase [Burkholderia sp. WAC0059]
MRAAQRDGLYDVAVIGAGPAGMAAAIGCAQHGLAVAVFDDQPAPGGQIYRGAGTADTTLRRILGDDYAAGIPMVRDFARCGADYFPGTAVWHVTPERRVHFVRDGAAASLEARHVVLATGAIERPFPVEGWTLPGVMGAGAAQILLKSAAAMPVGPVVLAGGGPLLYLLAWQYLRAGMPPSAIVDTASPRSLLAALPHLGGALANWPMLRKGRDMLRAIAGAGVPFYRGARGLAAEGRERVEALRFDVGGTTVRLPANVLLLHQGVVPNTQFTWALRAAHDWSDSQLCWTPRRDADGELAGLPGIHLAGDGAGIAGAAAAALQGERLALTLAARAGRLSAGEHAQRVRPLDRRLSRLQRIRPFLETAYRPLDEHRIPRDEVIVCRCEEIRAGTLREHVALGCLGPSQLKSFGRCGMGPCQGRQCGLTVTELMARERGVPPSEIGYFRVRAPVRPVTLGELAREPADQDI